MSRKLCRAFASRISFVVVAIAPFRKSSIASHRIASLRIAQSRTYRVAKFGGEPIGELLDARGDFIKRHGLFSAISFNDVHRARVYEYRVRRRANKNGDV